MKRYKYSFDESIHDYDMIEDENGEWVKWEDMRIFKQKIDKWYDSLMFMRENEEKEFEKIMET